MSNNKKGTEWYKEKVKKHHGEKVEILSEYINGVTPVNFVYHCEKHGDTYGTVNGKNICKSFFLPCKKCQSENKSKSAKNNKSDKTYYYNRLKQYCENRNGVLLSDKWTTAKDYYWFKCDNPNHPKFTTTADALWSGSHWCPYCSGRNGDFENEIKNIIESKNGTLLSHYKSQYEYVNVKCNKDNYEWNITPTNIKKGRWCPICNLPYSERVVWDWLNKFLDLDNYIIRVQYKFNDLKTNDEYLRFDFAILDINLNLRMLLEVDDEEHRDNHDNCDRRLIARERDIIKNNYCINNNIKLYRFNVPYRLNKKLEYNDYYTYINNELSNVISTYIISKEEK